MRQLAGPGVSRFCSEPSWQISEVTSSSRIASSGGFVTCANSCAEVVVERTASALERKASAASLPIEPIGSAPEAAIGLRRTLSSSSV